MGNKKITDLQLRSSVTDSLNFPSDDGIQSYRVTAAQIFAYLNSKFVAATSKAAPIAADIMTIFDSASSNAVKKITVAELRNAVYRAVTTTDSIGSDDETMVLSGASFTSTLPTAVGRAGKRYKLVHNGTSLSQVYTIATTSSQTISGRASAAIALYVKGEVFEVESDGANWIIVNQYIPKKYESHTPSSSQSGFGTISGVEYLWARDGNFLDLLVGFVAGTTSGSEARFELPGSLTVANISGSKLAGFMSSTVGYAGSLSVIANSGQPAYVNFGGQSSGSSAGTAQSGSSVAGTGSTQKFFARIPISQWSY